MKRVVDRLNELIHSDSAVASPIACVTTLQRHIPKCDTHASNKIRDAHAEAIAAPGVRRGHLHMKEDEVVLCGNKYGCFWLPAAEMTALARDRDSVAARRDVREAVLAVPNVVLGCDPEGLDHNYITTRPAGTAAWMLR